MKKSPRAAVRAKRTLKATSGRLRNRRTKAESQISALRESEERWKFALEGAGDGVWDWEVPTSYVVFSKRWKEMLGYEEDEIEGKLSEWESRVHPEDLPGALAVVRDHLEGRTPHYVNEFRMRCKDGRWKWIRARGMVTSRNRRGKPLRVIGTHTDVSAEKVAREREVVNLRLVVEDAPLSAILEALVRSVEADHPGMVCSVMLADSRGTTLELATAPGLPEEFKLALRAMPVNAEAGCCGRAVHFGRRVIAEDVSTDPQCKPWRTIARKAGVLSCWSEPIVGLSGRVVGAFACYHRSPHIPGAAEIEAISAAAQLAAVAIERDEEKKLLRESEARYRRIVQTAEEGILSIDAEARIDFVNPKMAQMLGYGAEEITGRPFAEILDEEGRSILAEKLEIRRKGIAEQFEFRFPRKDGSELWTFVSTNSIIDADGTYLGALGMFTDITRRRGTEAALRQSEERYARAVRGTSEGLWDWNILTGEDYLSPRWKEMLGFDDGELSNHEDTFRSLLHPEDVPRVQAAVKAHLQQRAPYDVELRLRTKGGGYRWFRARGEAVRDAEGMPVRMAGSISDITERKKAEAALQESEERYRLLADYTDDIVGLYDCEGRRLYLSPSFFRKTGWTPEDVASTDWRSRVHPLDLPAAEKARAISREIGPATHVEYRVRCRDGSWIWLSTSVKMIPDAAGRPWRQLIWSHDITERKRLEREVVDAAEAEQQRIGAELHDDLCQRLASLKLKMEMITSDLAKAGVPEAAQAEELWKQLADATHVTRQISKGLSPVDPQAEGLMVALERLVRSVEALYGVPCFLSCPEDVLVKNRNVAAHLYRIAQELMNNAARHASPSRIEVRLSADPTEVRVEVENDGATFRGTSRGRSGMGLRTMRFRAAATGATIQFLPRRDGQTGTLAVCTVPQLVCNPEIGAEDSGAVEGMADWSL